MQGGPAEAALRGFAWGVRGKVTEEEEDAEGSMNKGQEHQGTKWSGTAATTGAMWATASTEIADSARRTAL